LSERVYLNHGRRHVGRGTDPIYSDWHYVGAAGEAAFQNGWTNSGGTKAPMRWRFRPVLDPKTRQPGFDIEGSVKDGTPATTIFTLPFTVDYDLHRIVPDDSGNPANITVKQNGDVVDGFA